MKAPRIVTVGGIDIQGNAGGGRLTGGANVTVAGDAKHGYAICSTCPGEDQGTGTLNNITPTVNGACCIDTDCHITNATACANAGGTYQGDGTDCDPNPCVSGGACCITGSCSIVADVTACTDLGGVYFGDGSVCEDESCCDVCLNALDPTICIDGDGNCWTGQDNGSGCTGIQVPCDGTVRARTELFRCFPSGSCDTNETGHQTLDPVTCEFDDVTPVCEPFGPECSCCLDETTDLVYGCPPF